MKSVWSLKNWFMLRACILIATNKITYVNPEAYNDLRAALLATVPFQPKTILEEMQK